MQVHFLKTFGLMLVLTFALGPGAAVGQEGGTSAAEENPLTAEIALSEFHLEPHKPTELRVQLHLQKGFRAYADKFKFEISSPEGFRFQNFQIKPLQTFYDENSKHTKTGVIDNAVFTAPIEAPEHLPDGQQSLHVVLTYQACTAAYCLFPKHLELVVPFEFQQDRLPGVRSGETPATSVGWHLPANLQDALNQSLLMAFLVAFVAGFLTSLTPCVFPLIPITLAVLGRQAHQHSRGKNFALSVLYVLGICFTYSTLGILAAATGSMFGGFINNPYVLGVICAVFLTMAISMFGAFELQAPQFIRDRLSGDLKLTGFKSAFVYGIIAGVVAGPCVGPVLVGILTYVAKSQNLWLGFWLLFTFAFGMGQLFLLIGSFSQAIKLLPKSGGWMEVVNRIFAYLLLGTSLYYLRLIVSARLWDAGIGVALVVSASLLGAFGPVAGTKLSSLLNKGLQQTLVFVGAAFLTVAIFNLRPLLVHGETPAAVDSGALRWQPYSEGALQAAAQNHTPVLIDFWADWCTACKELESHTFTESTFVAVARNYVLLKFDATNDSDELKKLRDRYELVGLPTLLLFDQNGLWHKELTATEVIEAAELAKRMQSLEGSQRN